MLFDASRSTLLFVLLVLFVLLSVFIVSSHSSGHTIRHVYQRQLSVTTRFTFTTATLTDTVTTLTISHDQSEPLSRLASTSSLSTSFRPTLHSSFALSTSSSSSLLSMSFSSSTSQPRESTSLSSQALSVTPKTTVSFLQTPIPVSTPHTTVPPSVSDNKVTSVLPVITSPASSNQDVPLPSFSAASAGATSSGFWSNKGAVGGTFAAVGLVALAISAIFLTTCIKKRRNRKAEEEFYSGSLYKRDSYDWPAPADMSGLNRQLLDPFAAGDVVQICGNSMPFVTASTSSGHGHTNLEDNLSSSDDHTSNHGRINHPYSATHSDSRAGFNRPESASFLRPPRSPASASSRRTGFNIPPTHEPAVPVSPMSMASLSTIPSPYLDARQVNKRGHHQNSGASFYADQLHSYYYGEKAESPSARSFSRA